MVLSKKKGFVLVLGIVLMFSLLVTGCGGGGNQSSDQQAQDQAQEQEQSQEESSSDKKVVKVGVGNVGKEFEVTKKAAKMYEEENPNIDIELVSMPESSSERYSLYLQYLEAQSNKLDVYQTDVIWSGDMGEHFIDFKDYMSQSEIDKFFKGSIKNNTVDGELIAIPWFVDAAVMYYRTDLLEKYGFDNPPKTWEEMEKMAKKVQKGERAEGKQDFWGFVWQGEAYEGLTCDALEWVYSNGGGVIVSPDKKVTINNEKAAEAITMAADWIGEISPPGVTGMKEEDARKMWQGGHALFMRNWPYAYPLAKSDDSAVKGKFDIAPLPKGDSGHGAATLGGWQLAVSKYSDNKEAAAEVVKFLTSYKIQKLRAMEAGLTGSRKALYNDEEIINENPYFKTLLSVFRNSTPRPSTPVAPNYNEVSTAFFKSVYSVLNGEKEAGSALRSLEYKLKDITGFESGEPTKTIE
ncbi:ABC transporter substrate-binding protein [Halanaerobacter jeridensis]|uniref:Trehalose/maltose transport system substrate-binding protein n=1 Tax=Halanaerobacter jeridensis TaxID=706427 RepID=A0A939BNP1_9FIRM|nr:ABC transporter substrate-binding protein [Halanaerobacter jeridensis]MBM7555832.1 trehalose/maltose transport system substrate-binding protein [Halanaerobacter jeridensis]